MVLTGASAYIDQPQQPFLNMAARMSPPPSIHIRLYKNHELHRWLDCADLQFEGPPIPGDRSDDPLDVGVIELKGVEGGVR